MQLGGCSPIKIITTYPLQTNMEVHRAPSSSLGLDRVAHFQVRLALQKLAKKNMFHNDGRSIPHSAQVCHVAFTYYVKCVYTIISSIYIYSTYTSYTRVTENSVVWVVTWKVPIVVFSNLPKTCSFGLPDFKCNPAPRKTQQRISTKAPMEFCVKEPHVERHSAKLSGLLERNKNERRLDFTVPLPI